MKIALVILALTMFAFPAYGLSPQAGELDALDFSSDGLGIATPDTKESLNANTNLPDSIKPTAGKVTLVADFSAIENKKTVAVYLINDSQKDIDIENQDSDVYLKLETLSDTGEWVRAQPHAYSWCGNSYGKHTLKSGHFLKINGYQPESGTKARVRYRLFQLEDLELVTLAGNGLVNKTDIENASTDALAVSHGTFDVVASIALGERKIENKLDHIDLRKRAIHTLTAGRFPPAKVNPILDRIAAESPDMKHEIEYGKNSLALRTGTLDFVVSVASGKQKLGSQPNHQNLQLSAIETLTSGRFPIEKVEPIIDQIESDSPVVVEMAKYYLSELKSKLEK